MTYFKVVAATASSYTITLSSEELSTPLFLLLDNRMTPMIRCYYSKTRQAAERALGQLVSIDNDNVLVDRVSAAEWARCYGKELPVGWSSAPFEAVISCVANERLKETDRQHSNSQEQAPLIEGLKELCESHDYGNDFAEEIERILFDKENKEMRDLVLRELAIQASESQAPFSSNPWIETIEDAISSISIKADVKFACGNHRWMYPLRSSNIIRMARANKTKAKNLIEVLVGGKDVWVNLPKLEKKLEWHSRDPYADFPVQMLSAPLTKLYTADDRECVVLKGAEEKFQLLIDINAVERGVNWLSMGNLLPDDDLNGVTPMSDRFHHNAYFHLYLLCRDSQVTVITREYPYVKRVELAGCGSSIKFAGKC